jgi:hypothetical protein
MLITSEIARVTKPDVAGGDQRELERMQDRWLSATMHAKHAKAPSHGATGRKGEKYG